MDDSTVIDPEEFAREFEFEFELEPALGTAPVDASAGGRSWAMFSIHGHALIIIARNPEVQVSELSEQLKLGEAVVVRLIDDLITAGIVARVEIGGRTRFAIISDDPMVARLAAPQSVVAVHRLYGRSA
ncbi:MAG: hypothetical protein JWM34_4499 [Ilumatobacteraceae bacterium]|nr:hypothetical protein [Ilumatobacteraceae bacterium]